MDTMLNNIPYVVVKEYFFKNTASTMINFIKKLFASTKEAVEAVVNADDAASNAVAKAKEVGNGLMDKVKETF